MLVTITTDGGITGRGTGSAELEVDDAWLAQLQPETWRDEYEATGGDLIRYTLTFGERSVSFVDSAEIPRGLEELFEKVWRTGRVARPPL